MTEPTLPIVVPEDELARRQRKLNELANVQQTLYGMRALVALALEGDVPDFLKAKRLCEVADALRRAVGAKVKDFSGVDGVEFVCDVDEGGGVRPQIGRIGGGVEDLTRVLVGILERQTVDRTVVDAANTRAAEARTRESEGLELETLVKLLPMISEDDHRLRIERRIGVLMKNMEARDGLVHPDVLGGHQAHGEGEGQDARAADGDDERGTDGAPIVASRAEPAV